jgi:hypothetical protein
MGHTFHLLYVVDLAKPRFAWSSVVLTGDTYGSSLLGGVQEQFIDRVSFEETPGNEFLVRVYARHGKIRLRRDDEPELLPKPRVPKYEIDLRLDGDAFKVTPETAAAGQLFAAK